MLKTASSVINALGALVYQGTWDASANNPTLTSSVGTKGNYYVVSVAGTTTLNGISSWSVGDWAVFNGSVWQKVDGGTSESFVNLTVTGTANIATGNVVNMTSSNVTITGGTENAVTYTNVTISSGNVTVTNANLTYANVTTALRTQGLTGYLYGNANTGNVSAATTIPNTSVSGLGTMSTQNSNSVSITGGNVGANLSTSTAIPVANATGILAVGNGGTGLNSVTANYIPYGNGSNSLLTNSNLTFNGTNLSVGYSTTFGIVNIQRNSGAPQSTLAIADFGTPANEVGIYMRANGTNACGISTAGAPFQISTSASLGTNNLYCFPSGGVSIGNTTDPGAANLSVTGNVIQATAAKGFNFTANTPASGKTSQLLNWYEEGTWTPSVTSSGGSITTVGTVSGSYTRVGRVVHLFFNIAITTNGTGSGSILVANIPFAPNASNISQGVFRENSVNGKMGSVNIPNTSQIQLQFYDNSYPGSNGCTLVGQITYYV